MMRQDGQKRTASRRIILLTGLIIVGVLASCGAPAHATSMKTAPTLAPTPIVYARPTFETGVAFPRWGNGVYGTHDTGWTPGLERLKQQTGARWVEMVVNLYQETDTSTDVHTGSGTPTPDALEEGILTARENGFSVFVVPLLTVTQERDSWGGHVAFSDAAQAQAWFASYWQALEPYMVAAAHAKASQIAIGTEYSDLESAPSYLWEQLIQEAHSVFPGDITYDMNWTSVDGPTRAWMSDPLLSFIGVSEYTSLETQPHDMTASQVLDVWRRQFLPRLDALSTALGKPLLISEVGYRTTSDALVQPFLWHSTAPFDPQLQAAAYSGAVQAALGDRHIVGIYFWAWENGQFSPENLPAAAALRALYLSPQS